MHHLASPLSSHEVHLISAIMKAILDMQHQNKIKGSKYRIETRVGNRMRHGLQYIDNPAHFVGHKDHSLTH